MTQESTTPVRLWEKYANAVEEVERRLVRVTGALHAARVPFSLVGGQAVALWVATKDPAAVRTTKNVDILVRRADVPAIVNAAFSIAMEYFEVLGAGMLLDREDPNVRRAVHILWAGEKVRPECRLPSPSVDDFELLDPSLPVVSLPGLVRMKLMANRDHDRTHLRDMIDVDLISRDMLAQLPAELAMRLDALLTESGR